jgi:hypothetical protein
MSVVACAVSSGKLEPSAPKPFPQHPSGLEVAQGKIKETE